MKDWKYILRRTDLFTEHERLKKLREEKASKNKNRAKTNAQIQAEKMRLAEYQMYLANKTFKRQIWGSGWINGGGQYNGSGSISTP